MFRDVRRIEVRDVVVLLVNHLGYLQLVYRRSLVKDRLVVSVVLKVVRKRRQYRGLSPSHFRPIFPHGAVAPRRM